MSNRAVVQGRVSMSMENQIFCARSSTEKEHRIFLLFRPEGQGISISCIRKFLVVILSSIRNQQEIFAGATLSSTLCVPMNHATEIILPLFPFTLI